MVDDLKNVSALELLHHVWPVVHEVNEAAETCPMDPVGTRHIKNNLDAIRQKYPISSVLSLVTILLTVTPINRNDSKGFQECERKHLVNISKL